MTKTEAKAQREADLQQSRTRGVLKVYRDTLRIKEFLYGTPEAYIVVENVLGAKLKVTAHDDGEIYTQVVDGGLPATLADFATEDWANIIAHLHESPAEMHPKAFKTQWDEVAHGAALVRTLNPVDNA